MQQRCAIGADEGRREIEARRPAEAIALGSAKSTLFAVCRLVRDDFEPDGQQVR